MKKTVTLYILILTTLTISAKVDTVGVSFNSTTSTPNVEVPSVEAPNTEAPNVDIQNAATSSNTEGTINDSVPTVKPLKKQSCFKRAYLFCDRILSPPRDTNYIDTQENYNWCAEVQLTNRFELFEMDAGSRFNMCVIPKVHTRIGPFFGWRFAFLGYNIDIKSVFVNDDDTDLGASVYSAAFGLDLFYRRVGGNYNVHSLTIDNTDYSTLLRGQPFDGIKLGMTRVSFYYVPNYKHFSHQAAYSQANRQLRSAGSLILGASYAHNRMTMDWEKFSRLISNINCKDYSSNTLYGSQKNDEFSATGGYAYNWVFAKNWLLGSELTGSLGYLLQHTATKQKDENEGNIFSSLENFSKKSIAFNATLRFALLYNNGPWFFGTQGYAFYYKYGNGVMMTRNLLGTVYCYVGFNF